MRTASKVEVIFACSQISRLIDLAVIQISISNFEATRNRRRNETVTHPEKWAQTLDLWNVKEEFEIELCALDSGIGHPHFEIASFERMKQLMVRKTPEHYPRTSSEYVKRA